MATGKVIGRVEVSLGKVRFVDTEGNFRDGGYEGLMYEGEQIYSDDPNALFQIKYLALPEATAYDGVFRVLADGSVISGLDGNENMFGDDIDLMETAAGDAGAEGSSAFLEEVPVDESSLLGFGRGADDTQYGEGITGFSVVSDDGTPPVITSANNVIFDENNPDAVMQVTATDTSAITFSINGLDSGLFSIDPVTGVLTFNDIPDYENPQDAGGDNEYNMYVTVTDAYGNFTTQLISINVNNLNDNIPTAEDGANAAIEDGVLVSGQLVGEDADGNEIRYELGEDLGEDEGTLVFNSDGSYTYDIGGAFQDLAHDETRDITFTYRTVEVGPPLSEPSDAGPFESTWATVTITITGTNDQPEISKVYINDNLEALGTGNTTIEGSLATATDIDTLDADDITYHFAEGSRIEVRVENNTIYDWAPQEAVDAIEIHSVTVNAEGTFSVVGDFNSLAEGESVKVRFRYVADDNQDQDNSVSDVKTVVLIVTGTNDVPVSTVESITKIADHMEYVTMDDITTCVWSPGILSFISYQNNNWFGVNEFLFDKDNNQMVDSKGWHNDVVRMSTNKLVDNIDLEFKNIDPNDNIRVEVWNDGQWNVVHSGALTGSGQVTLPIDPGYDFSQIKISALDSNRGNTQFRINRVVESTQSETVDTMLPFVIDDTMLLANDTDVDGDALHFELVDGKLYDADGIEIGTVTMVDGDVQVTPDENVDFDADAPGYASFEYVVVDEHGAQSEATTATIDVAVGEVTGTQISYDQQSAEEYIIGTDTEVAMSDNILAVGEEGTLDLAHVSDINTVELGEDATVTGSSDLGHITAGDVLNATDVDNTLVIQSSDGNAHDQVDVHESLTQIADTDIGGTYYAQYVGEGATLLIEIEPPMDDVEYC